MSFQNIFPVEKPDTYLDLAFSKATKKARDMKSKKLRIPRSEIFRKVELTRVNAVGSTIGVHLTKLIKSFPSLDQLTPFYQELFASNLDIGLLKKSLGGLNWLISTSDKFTSKYCTMINKTYDVAKMMQLRREYYGRVSSLFKQTKDVFQHLHEARKIIVKFPVVKQMPTVAICGFPNIGKTTLLSKLTDSKPEIAGYAFTTKTLNMGYQTYGDMRVQFIDTPGTLNRFNKMNFIEQQAYLATKHCADLLVYIYDLSEPYSLRDQQLLLEQFKKLNKPILLFLSKTDIIPKEIVQEFVKDKTIITDIKVLNQTIIKSLKPVHKTIITKEEIRRQFEEEQDNLELDNGFDENFEED